MRLKNFDEFIAIDWSGAKTPINNPHISLAHCKADNFDMPTLPRVAWSRQGIFDELLVRAKQNKRILVGIDCNFSFCDAMVDKICGSSSKTNDLWAFIDDICHHSPNFFAGNFWEHDHYKNLFWTAGTQPTWFDKKKLQRRVEQICADKKLGEPESPFKLIGSKQVGKGGMAGMRVFHQLKIMLGERVAFFPFDDEATLNKAELVLTEIYPRLFWMMAGLGRDKITNEDLLKQGLSYFNVKPQMKNLMGLSNDQTDALISAAGLRFLCGNKAFIPQNYTDFDDLIFKKIRKEGWIFGV